MTVALCMPYPKQLAGQLLTSQPLLGPVTQASQAQLSQHLPRRTVSTERLQTNPQQVWSSTPLLSRPPSLHRLGSVSPSGSLKQGSVQRQSSLHRQASGQSSESFKSVTGRAAPATAAVAETAEAAMCPVVHAIAVMGGRVITSSSTEAGSVLQEWSTDGMLLLTHVCCSLGETSVFARDFIVCMTAAMLLLVAVQWCLLPHNICLSG